VGLLVIQFRRTRTQSRELNDVQDATDAAFRQLSQVPFLRGVLFEHTQPILASAGATVLDVTHGLGRRARGWLVIDVAGDGVVDAPVVLWRRGGDRNDSEVMQIVVLPYDVELVHDGRSALERVRSEAPIDLILLDILMPHVSGLEVLAELRQLPHRQATPVIMLTAKGQEADRERAAELGATDFLTKPFSPKKLLARIDEILTC
jgi:CheY-like chemotaxis protein